ncbi:MAG: heme-binding protein, partial [Planctomycetes bacterium]|nr:heme-binding protein [Planctomycetota bacterium]
MQLHVEQLETRMMPAFIASQLPLAALPPLTLTTSQVSTLLQRAAGATASDDAIIAVVDRNGRILGVRVEGHVSAAVTGNSDVLDFSIDGAVALARTAAFFSTSATPLTSRTIQFISQSTITQREVNSYTFISNPTSTTGGPGFVAPIGIGGHFPPGVANTPQVDLFGIEHTNRDMLVNPGPNGVLNTPFDGGFGADDVGLTGRFNINPAFIPAGKTTFAPLSYFDTIKTAVNQRNPVQDHVASRGVGTLPGGIPIYKDGVLLGGIGVFFPGATGFASEENSMLSRDYNPNKIDRSLEAEFIALSAVGGSKAAGFPIGTIAGIPALSGFDLPFPRIDLVGITLDTVGPGGAQGPRTLVNYVTSYFGIGTGNPNSGMLMDVTSVAGVKFVAGAPAPDGWLVTPHAGVGLSAAQVQEIIVQGINQANQTRAQIRPLGTMTRMVLAAGDSKGEVLGLYRMPDSPMFSINVAVSKARNAAYYNDAAQLLAPDKLAGIPAGTALTARTFRYVALPRFPEGIDPAPPGVWSTLTDPGVNRNTGLNTGAALPISAIVSILGYDAFHPNTNFHQSSANASGVVFFPGSSGVYVNGKIVGGFGVSGDGVDEDDVVTSAGIVGYGPSLAIQVDQFFFGGVRL